MCRPRRRAAYPYAFDNADNLTTNNGTMQQYNTADELCWTVTGCQQQCLRDHYQWMHYRSANQCDHVLVRQQRQPHERSS